MAKYKALEESFIDNRIVQPGTIVDYDGEPGTNLEAVDEAPKRGRKPAEDAGE